MISDLPTDRMCRAAPNGVLGAFALVTDDHERRIAAVNPVAQEKA